MVKAFNMSTIRHPNFKPKKKEMWSQKIKILNKAGDRNKFLWTSQAVTRSMRSILSERPTSYTPITANSYSEYGKELLKSVVSSKNFRGKKVRKELTCVNESNNLDCVNTSCHNELCFNRRIQNPSEFIVLRHPLKGFILLARQTYIKGDFIIEYVGEAMTPVEYNRRFDNKETSGLYAFKFEDRSVNLELIIDSEFMGNDARFISHSCGPNAEARVWIVKNTYHVVIFATKFIQANKEICISYGSEYAHFNIKCRCGFRSCDGIIS